MEVVTVGPPGSVGFSIGRSIDIKRVFITAWGAINEATLGRYKVPRSLRNWVNHLLAGQTITASKGETLIKERVISGWPKIGVISLLLWNPRNWDIRMILWSSSESNSWMHNLNHLENSTRRRYLVCEAYPNSQSKVNRSYQFISSDKQYRKVKLIKVSEPSSIAEKKTVFLAGRIGRIINSTNFLCSHFDFFHENLTAVIDEHHELSNQDIRTMEKRYQGKCNSNKKAELLNTEEGQSEAEYSRKWSSSSFLCWEHCSLNRCQYWHWLQTSKISFCQHIYDMNLSSIDRRAKITLLFYRNDNFERTVCKLSRPI